MIKYVTTFTMAAFLVAASFAVPTAASAKGDKAKAASAQAKECLKISDPKKKDECVKKAEMKSKKGMSTKADKKGK